MPVNLVNNPTFTVNTQPVAPVSPEKPNKPERNTKAQSEYTDEDGVAPEEKDLREPQPAERKSTNVGNNIDIKI